MQYFFGHFPSIKGNQSPDENTFDRNTQANPKMAQKRVVHQFFCPNCILKLKQLTKFKYRVLLYLSLVKHECNSENQRKKKKKHTPTHTHTHKSLNHHSINEITHILKAKKRKKEMKTYSVLSEPISKFPEPSLAAEDCRNHEKNTHTIELSGKEVWSVWRSRFEVERETYMHFKIDEKRHDRGRNPRGGEVYSREFGEEDENPISIYYNALRLPPSSRKRLFGAVKGPDDGFEPG